MGIALYTITSSLSGMHMVHIDRSLVHANAINQLTKLYEQLFWYEDYERLIGKELTLFSLKKVQIGGLIAQIALQLLDPATEIAACKMHALLKNCCYYFNQAANQSQPLPFTIKLLLQHQLRLLAEHPIVKGFPQNHLLYVYFINLTTKASDVFNIASESPKAHEDCAQHDDLFRNIFHRSELIYG